jgi:beta-1,4-mannosyltransferase
MTSSPIRVLAWPAYKQRALNPYTWLLYSHMRSAQVDEFTPSNLLRKRYDIWHLHWPETFLNRSNPLAAFTRANMLLRMMDVARLKGVKTVWTVHNIGSHEQQHAGMESWFWRAFIKRLDGYISLSRSGLLAAQKRFPELEALPGMVIPHGHYRDEYPIGISDQARSVLGLGSEDMVVLFFGAVRAYKGVPQLVRCFCGLSEKNARLVVVGRCKSPGLAGSIANACGGDRRIRLDLKFIEKEQVQLYFQAANLVVLPYREILNSGAALLALSFNRPVLVPDKGAMAELQADIGQEWVSTYQGELTTSILHEALAWATDVSRPAIAPLEHLNWQAIAEQTITAYEWVCAGKVHGIPEPSPASSSRH